MSESSLNYSSNESENIDINLSSNLDNDESLFENIINENIEDVSDSSETNITYHNYQQNYTSNYLQTPEFIDLELKCLPFIFYHHYDDIEYLENGSKIILPKKVLYEISKYEDISYPLKFKINDHNTLFSVHEFREDIDEVLLPNNYIANMNLEPYQSCKVTLVTTSVQTGKKIILKAHSSKFLDIPDHKKFLEQNLNTLYTFLTKGQTILVPSEEDKLYIDVINCEPSENICIIDTDLEVDFEEPYDYKEYIQRKQEELEKTQVEREKIKESRKNTNQFKIGKINFNQNHKNNEDDNNGKPFINFSGKGHRLGSK